MKSTKKRYTENLISPGSPDDPTLSWNNRLETRNKDREQKETLMIKAQITFSSGLSGVGECPLDMCQQRRKCLSPISLGLCL